MWEIFEKLREQRGVSLYQIGNDLGINPSSFSNWKAGRYTPKQDKLKRIADYFGVSVEYLMTGETSGGYYINPETAAVAQQIFENKELRLLFDAAADATPEDLQLVHQMLLALKAKERPD